MTHPRRPLAMLATSLLFAAVVGQQAMAQTAATQGKADVPDAVSGTYELVFDNTATGELPYSVGEKVKIVIDGSSNSLCIKGERQLFDSRDSQTFFKAVNSFETTLSGQYRFTYTLQLENNGFKELFVYGGSTLSGNNFINNQGYLRGSRLSTSTDCSTMGVAAVLTLAADEQSALTLAEELYPTLLVNGSALGSYLGYTYRHYASTGVYVGFKDGKIYTMGGSFGPAIKEQGTAAAVLGALQTAKAKLVGASGQGFTLASATPATHNTTLTFTSGAGGVLEMSTTPKTCQLYFENAKGSNGQSYFFDIRYRPSDKAVLSAAIGSGSFLVNSGDNVASKLALDKAAGKAVFTQLAMFGKNSSALVVNGSFALPTTNIPAACAL
jgi:hypothetical protein